MRELAKIWFAVGTQSVGGGTSTLFLIRRFLVEQRGWLTIREYTEAWGLSQLSPCIHIVARRLARRDVADDRRDRHDGAAGRDAARQGATDIRARAGVIDPFTLFVILLKASSLSLGGFGSLPLLRQDLVVTGIATEAQIV